MNGEIGAESEPGKGSTFWFTAAFEKQPQAEKVEPEPTVDIRGKRILIVDDNMTNLEILKGYLESWDCVCDLASSGEMALTIMRAVAKVGSPFDLVITDMQMPNMDGAELGVKIKKDPVLRGTMMVMLTSRGMRGDAAEIKEIGFAAYLTKPVKRTQLFDCLVTVFGSKPRQAPLEEPQIITRHTIAEEKRGRSRILVAEDNIINQKLALRLLEKFGYHADAVANGQEAVKALEIIPYDIVLMDVQMPEMDGLEATKIVRDPQSTVKNHNVPIIAMTAHAMKGDRQICLDEGMDDYLAKPINPRELFNTIEKYL